MSIHKGLKVYIVMLGEAHEGGSILDVFSTEESAVDWCKRYMVVEQHPQFVPAQTRRSWVEESPTSWRRGCDILSVQEWDVRERL